MFKANYKATLKTLVRHPAIIIAFVAVIITIVTKGYWTHGYGIEEKVVNHICGVAYGTTWVLIFPPFLGIMIASNLLSEVDNNFCDVLSPTNLSFLKFVSSKVLAYWTLATAVHLLFAFVKMFHYWVIQGYVLGGREVTLNIWQILWRYLFNEAVYLPLSLLVATAVAFFCIGVTRFPVMGAVGLLGYVFLDNIFPALYGEESVWGGIIYYVPKQLLFYCAAVTWDIPTSAKLEEFRINSLLYIYPEKAIAGLVYNYAFSIILLFISYFLLRKRYNIGMPVKNN